MAALPRHAALAIGLAVAALVIGLAAWSNVILALSPLAIAVWGLMRVSLPGTHRYPLWAALASLATLSLYAFWPHNAPLLHWMGVGIAMDAAVVLIVGAWYEPESLLRAAATERDPAAREELLRRVLVLDPKNEEALAGLPPDPLEGIGPLHGPRGEEALRQRLAELNAAETGPERSPEEQLRAAARAVLRQGAGAALWTTPLLFPFLLVWAGAGAALALAHVAALLFAAWGMGTVLLERAMARVGTGLIAFALALIGSGALLLGGALLVAHWVGLAQGEGSLHPGENVGAALGRAGTVGVMACALAAIPAAAWAVFVAIPMPYLRRSGMEASSAASGGGKEAPPWIPALLAVWALSTLAFAMGTGIAMIAPFAAFGHAAFVGLAWYGMWQLQPAQRARRSPRALSDARRQIAETLAAEQHARDVERDSDRFRQQQREE